MNTPRRTERLKTLAVLLALLSGCLPAKRTRTIVTGAIEPRHFQFVTVVKQTGTKPGGWRAACVHVNIQRVTGESFLCKFGVDVPIENEDAHFSVPLAQRIAAERANEAARLVFSSATPASGLGLLCEDFKAEFGALLGVSIRGSRVKTACHEKTIPVQFGEWIP
ncbi:MAG TPA: hypothetical protein VFZ09_17510 [Archangium sp.]|uniref:hypothetical protein n=1 Tax=Archangium sp. TaxID=1872627 RepID=UPI002E349AAB|nr:hypothetical protein [Archangium sp.]HEX5748043.1 hypothetical protein [Archangium sp.]